MEMVKSWRDGGFCGTFLEGRDRERQEIPISESCNELKFA